MEKPRRCARLVSPVASETPHKKIKRRYVILNPELPQKHTRSTRNATCHAHPTGRTLTVSAYGKHPAAFAPPVARQISSKIAKKDFPAPPPRSFGGAAVTNSAHALVLGSHVPRLGPVALSDAGDGVGGGRLYYFFLRWRVIL